MRLGLRLVWLASAVWASGCLEVASGPDSGLPAVDAGANSTDASVGSDAGAKGDGGTSVDGGAGSVDAGSQRPDAGADAGTAAGADAGTAAGADAGTPFDAGVPGYDSGDFLDDGGLPAWRKGAPLNAFIPIAGTEGAGGAAVDPWGAFTLREDTSELFILAAGGHHDSSDNRVVSINLLADAPTWQLRCAPSPTATPLAEYYPDGKPGSTHLYDYTAWVPQAAGGQGRLLRLGMHGRFDDGGDNFNVDGFNPFTNTWDPAGTYPNTPGTVGTVRDRKTGVVYAGGGAKKLVPGASSWADTNGLEVLRFPHGYDSKRNAIFSLQWGNGEGYDTGVSARLAYPEASATDSITFNPSPASTQFEADQPCYAAMDYDEVNDQYLFYTGQTFNNGALTGDVTTRVYVITPNASRVWDMSFLPIGPGGVAPAAAPASGAGINGRFKYVKRLGGFVLLPQASATLYFLRTN